MMHQYLSRLLGSLAAIIRLRSPRNFTLQAWDGQNWEMYSDDGRVFYDINKTIVIRKL